MWMFGEWNLQCISFARYLKHIHFSMRLRPSFSIHRLEQAHLICITELNCAHFSFKSISMIWFCNKSANRACEIETNQNIQLEPANMFLPDAYERLEFPEVELHSLIFSSRITIYEVLRRTHRRIKCHERSFIKGFLLVPVLIQSSAQMQ